jgi:hypothetical protein
VEEARRVLERLDRIEALEHAHAPAAALLDELRALVADAEAWARREHHSPPVLDRVRGRLDREGAMSED